MTKTEIRALALTAAVTAAASAVAASLASALTSYLVTKAAQSQEKKAQMATIAKQLLAAQAPLYGAWRKI